MNPVYGSDYNRDQWVTLDAIRNACNRLSGSNLEELRGSIQPYLNFRRSVDAFYTSLFEPVCRESCFVTDLSGCCGFESIITFFADHVISFLMASPEETAAMFRILEQPNRTTKCVYLGKNGCLWKVRPISCGMFFCDQARQTGFESHPEAAELWNRFQAEEKEYTWPTRPVLFDKLERIFMDLGADSPHMFFHKSPGLKRLKTASGLGS